MCAPRRDGEPWAFYAFRYTVELVEEHARSVLAVIGLVAAAFLYSDLRGLILAQTESYQHITEELREMNIRISNLEHKANN